MYTNYIQWVANYGNTTHFIASIILLILLIYICHQILLMYCYVLLYVFIVSILLMYCYLDSTRRPQDHPDYIPGRSETFWRHLYIQEAFSEHHLQDIFKLTWAHSHSGNSFRTSFSRFFSFRTSWGQLYPYDILRILSTLSTHKGLV